MKKLKILQLLPAFNTGGVEEGALAISNALIKEGHQSYIASSGGSKVHIARANGALHYTLDGLAKKSPIAAIKAIKELHSIVKSEKIDIIHARSRWPAWLGFLVGIRTNTPFMTTFHGAHKVQNKWKNFYNSVMVRTRHVISISDYLTQYICKNYSSTLRKYNTKIHTIYRGLDETRFNPDTIKDEEVLQLKSEWGIKENDRVIILPARLTRLKGHDILIKAIAKIDTTNIKVICVGAQSHDDKKYREEIENLIKENKLEDVITIAKAVDNMPAAYKISSLVIFPSNRPEAFGRIVIESQAMGVPIITSNIGAQATLIEHGISGWLFVNNDSTSLAEQINHVLRLPEEVKLLYAKNMRKLILENFTQTIMTKRTIEVYQEVIKEK